MWITCTKSDEVTELKHYVEGDAFGNLNEKGELLCFGHMSTNTFST